ncbi:MAG TPA: hypothetical protein DDY14_17515 [Chromatiaceae bacterium]|jgi:hypothetical protein|nr:MAG: hypothetical protein N838_21205 [Thiohalocapsa sp. PB-PSB1]HBG97079.1 hypothetical protein [Chromatiaceae bacterium]HCS89835.1 hypothetical protein [Chromatiaceae bacterium]
MVREKLWLEENESENNSAKTASYRNAKLMRKLNVKCNRCVRPSKFPSIYVLKYFLKVSDTNLGFKL